MKLTAGFVALILTTSLYSFVSGAFFEDDDNVLADIDVNDFLKSLRTKKGGKLKEKKKSKKPRQNGLHPAFTPPIFQSPYQSQPLFHQPAPAYRNEFDSDPEIYYPPSQPRHPRFFDSEEDEDDYHYGRHQPREARYEPLNSYSTDLFEKDIFRVLTESFDMMQAIRDNEDILGDLQDYTSALLTVRTFLLKERKRLVAQSDLRSNSNLT